MIRQSTYAVDGQGLATIIRADTLLDAECGATPCSGGPTAAVPSPPGANHLAMEGCSDPSPSAYLAGDKLERNEEPGAVSG